MTIDITSGQFVIIIFVFSCFILISIPVVVVTFMLVWRPFCRSTACAGLAPRLDHWVRSARGAGGGADGALAGGLEPVRGLPDETAESGVTGHLLQGGQSLVFTVVAPHYCVQQFQWSNLRACGHVIIYI